FPTKDHWRGVSRLSGVVAGLKHVEAHIDQWGGTSLAVPPLRSGEGQLEWRVVGKALYRHLARAHIPGSLLPGHALIVTAHAHRNICWSESGKSITRRSAERASFRSITRAASRPMPASSAVIDAAAERSKFKPPAANDAAASSCI